MRKFGWFLLIVVLLSAIGIATWLARSPRSAEQLFIANGPRSWMTGTDHPFHEPPGFLPFVPLTLESIDTEAPVSTDWLLSLDGAPATIGPDEGWEPVLVGAVPDLDPASIAERPIGHRSTENSGFFEGRHLRRRVAIFSNLEGDEHYIALAAGLIPFGEPPERLPVAVFRLSGCPPGWEPTPVVLWMERVESPWYRALLGEPEFRCRVLVEAKEPTEVEGVRNEE